MKNTLGNLLPVSVGKKLVATLAKRVVLAPIVLILLSFGGARADELLNIVTMAGKGLDIGDGGQATAGQLSNVRNVDFDSSGNMYIVDFTGHRIRKVDKTTGIITTVAGTGVGGPVGDGGPATAAQIDGPGGVAFDSSGNLYISEFFGHRVRKVDTTGIITTVAGTGVAGYSLLEDDGPATLARLNQPTGIAVDSAGNLYIADELNHRIRKVAAGIITTVAGTGVAGYAHPGCPAGDGCSAIVARLANPADVAVDSSGNLYIADTQNHRIRKVSTAGIITTVAGTGVAGYSLLEDGGSATLARINLPRGVAVDSSGNLYIGEFNGHRVRKVSTTGIITTVAGTGVPGYSLLEDGGSATAAQLASPAGVAIDSSGDLYIADFSNLRIRKVAAGIITTVAGGGVLALYDGSPATLGQLNGSRDVVVDSSGNIYIADFNNQSVRKVSTTGIITTVAGTGTAGYSLLEDGGLATLARLNGPWGLAVDSSGNLYIADSNNSRIRKVSTTGIITTVAGTGTAGYSLLEDGGSATLARINVPRGLAADPSGNLYIADVGNSRIRKVDTTGIITTVAGNGTAGYLADNVPAIATRINRPFDVNVDSAGNLYIADTSNSRIRKVDRMTGIITTVAGTEISGFLGDGDPATAARLNQSKGVAVDPAGNLYISDSVNNRVRKVNKTTGIITTVVGTAFGGFSGDGGLATSALVNNPIGLGFDSAGNLYIADSGNSRIRRLNLATQVDVAPNTLSIAHSKAKWVTAYIQFPAGRDASDVNVNSVMLQAINPADGAVRHSLSNQELQTGRAAGSPNGFVDTNEDGVSDLLIVKFGQATVASWAAGAPELVLRVQGQLQPPLGSPAGTYFSGDTQIQNVYPPNPSP